MTVEADALPLNEVRRLACEHYEARNQTRIEPDRPPRFSR
jgi:hypothetical protein